MTALCDWLAKIALAADGCWLRTLVEARFLDALRDSHPARARSLLGRPRPFVPADGKVRGAGGTADEALHPLDLAPGPANRHIARPTARRSILGVRPAGAIASAPASQFSHFGINMRTSVASA